MKSIIFLCSFFFLTLNSALAQDLNGAWINQNEQSSILILIQDNYISRTVYTPTEFIETSGGTLKIEDDLLKVDLEFNTSVKELNSFDFHFELKDEKTLMIDYLNFTRIDDGKSQLAGVWQISGRNVNGEFVKINHTGTRKTLKLLTGSYFQWFAIDPAENKFMGTGGGTYTFENGKYTENIKFFSKDNTRVGASLVFDDKIEGGQWIHTGFSSKGDPINEVWEKVKQVIEIE